MISIAAAQAPSLDAPRHSALKARRLGIDMQQEAVVFMRRDCHVCRAEGFTAHARVQLTPDRTTSEQRRNRIRKYTRTRKTGR